MSGCILIHWTYQISWARSVHPARHDVGLGSVMIIETTLTFHHGQDRVLASSCRGGGRDPGSDGVANVGLVDDGREFGGAGQRRVIVVVETLGF